MKKILCSINSDDTCCPGVIILKFFLWILSLVYSLAARVLYLCYEKGLLKRYYLGKPVISIGNITVGGVGKTPLVILITKYLLKKGLRPVVLIRGYMDKSCCEGRGTKGESRTTIHDSRFSDEAAMLKDELKGVPVLVGVNRAKNALDFMRNNQADVFVMDDGFQHWKIHRDLDIVVIDSGNPFGNRHVLPRGVLREPIPCLKRADLLVLSKVGEEKDRIKVLEESLNNMFPGKTVVESSHKPYQILDLKEDTPKSASDLKDRLFCSFCSIGDPGSFLSSLEKSGIKSLKNYSFIDHYQYNGQDLLEILNYCAENKISDLITTQKDAVKIINNLDLFKGVNIYILKIVMELSKGKDHFFERVDSIL